MVSLESDSPISRTLLLDANTTGEDPCELDLTDAPLAPLQTMQLDLPGIGPTGVSITHAGFQSNNVVLTVTGVTAVKQGPVIGRVHPEPTAGDIGGVFTYSMSAYVPSAGSSNGAGITGIKFRLFEWTDFVRGATFGVAGCHPTCAGGPAGHRYPAPILPCPGTTANGCGPPAPMPPDHSFVPSGPPYVWTFDTSVLKNGLYWLFVEATGENNTRTVTYWPHAVYNGS